MKTHFNWIVRLLTLSVLLISALSMAACGAAATPFPVNQSKPNSNGSVPTSAPVQQQAAQSTPVPTRQPQQPAPTVATVKPNATTTALQSNNPPVNPATSNQYIVTDMRLAATALNVEVAIANIKGIASNLGGYLVSSSMGGYSTGTATLITGEIKIAVPANRLDEALSMIRKITLEVDPIVNAASTNVGGQIVDMETRTQKMDEAVERTREMLQKAQTNDEAIKLNAQLKEAERQNTEAHNQLEALKTRAAFSTIIVGLRQANAKQESDPTPTLIPTQLPVTRLVATPIAPSAHANPAVTSAIETQAALLQLIVDLFTWIMIVVMPYVVIIAGIIWLVRFVNRRA